MFLRFLAALSKLKTDDINQKQIYLRAILLPILIVVQTLRSILLRLSHGPSRPTRPVYCSGDWDTSGSVLIMNRLSQNQLTNIYLFNFLLAYVSPRCET
jgi:hypothetical protein